MWGRRFRLPTRYVLPQKASPLASRSHGGNLPVCHLAFGWLHPTGPAAAAAQEAPISAGRAFVILDREVDKAASGPVWLRDARVASMVADALLYGENGRHFYQLRAWVTMPNHVHILLLPKTPLPVITRWLKGSTARKANLILDRTGRAFWQDESFDHRVRDEAELDRIVHYVEYNPVSAGLAANPRKWHWSSAGLAGESACPTIGANPREM
jgi:putative transposase